MAPKKAELNFWRAIVHRCHAEDAPTTTTGVPEWAIVQNFYAALHMTQAYFETQPRSPLPIQAHSQRAQAMESYPVTESRNLKARNFRTAYNRLKSVSEQVRYDPEFTTRLSHVQDSRSDRDCVFSYLGTKVASFLESGRQ